MKKLVLVIMTQGDFPRMNASSANEDQGQEEQSIVQGNVRRSLVGIDRHGKDVGKGEVLKYLRIKLLPSH